MGVREIAKMAVLAYTCPEAYKKMGERHEAEARLASVAPAKFSFVDALRPVACQIAGMRREASHETYVQICNEAAELLCAGMDQAEVLWHFDMMLYNALHPDRRAKKEGGG